MAMTQNRAGRLRPVDGLRGFAVVLMMIHHFPNWLLAGKDESLPYALAVLVSRPAAPLFLFVVGVSLALSADRRRRTQKDAEIMAHFLKRGILLFAGGYVINAMVYYDFFEFNILHTIGASIMLLAYPAVKSTPKTQAAALLLLAAASAAVYPALGAQPFIDAVQYPPLPWTIFSAVGLMAGGFILKLGKTGRHEKIPYYMEALAALSMLAAAAAAVAGDGLSMVPPSWLYLLFLMASVAYATAISFFVCGLAKAEAITRPFEAYGTYAIEVYFIHLLFAATLPGVFGLLDKLSEAETFVYMLAFFAVSCPILLRFHQRRLTEEPEK